MKKIISSLAAAVLLLASCAAPPRPDQRAAIIGFDVGALAPCESQYSSDTCWSVGEAAIPDWCDWYECRRVWLTW